MNVPPGTQVEVFLHSPEAGAMEASDATGVHPDSWAALRVLPLQFGRGGRPRPQLKAVVGAVDIFMP